MRKAPGMFQGLQELSAQLQETPTTQIVNRVTSLLLFAKGNEYIIWLVCEQTQHKGRRLFIKLTFSSNAPMSGRRWMARLYTFCAFSNCPLLRSNHQYFTHVSVSCEQRFASSPYSRSIRFTVSSRSFCSFCSFCSFWLVCWAASSEREASQRFSYSMHSPRTSDPRGISTSFSNALQLKALPRSYKSSAERRREMLCSLQ